MDVDYEYWTHFKVSGVLNQTVTFRIMNANAVPFLSDTAHESQMVYSCDGENWNRITNHSYSGGVYTFTQEFTCDEVQIATFFPFSYTKMDAFVDTVSASQWADKTVLGTSHQGRDLDLLTITDTVIPIEDKKIIYIIGRQHSAETASSHMLEGMIDFLVSDDVDAGAFRQNCVWYIVPMVNPDGVYVGNSRATSEGNDPNRDWGNMDTVEVNTVRSDIQTINATDDIDMFIDWHNQMNDVRWYNFVYSPSGNTFFTFLSDWTGFDSQSAGGVSTCTVGACSSRAWGTDEGLFTFVFEPTPHLFTWTIDAMKQEGVNVAHAIGEYFGAYNYPLLVDSDFDISNDTAELRENSVGEKDWYESRGVLDGGDPTLLTLDEATIGGNSTKKGALKNYGIGNNAYLTQDFGSPQDGTFSVSFDIYIDRIELNAPDSTHIYNRTGFIYMGDNSRDGVSGDDPDDFGKGPNSTSLERFAFLTFYDPDPENGENDLELRARELNYHSSGASQSWHRTHEWTQVASALSYDTWYTIRLDVDFSGGTYDVYVNGVLEGDDINGFEDYGSSNLTHLSFSVGDTGKGDFYVDNVEEYVEAPDCVDADEDGHYAISPTCPTGTDCDDTNGAVNPDEDEICDNEIDDDCDGYTDCDDDECAGGPLLTDSDFNANVDHADLRDANPPGDYWYESRGDVPTLLTLDTADIEGNNTKKAGFAASASGNAYVTQQFSAAQTDMLAVQWDVFVDNILDDGNRDRGAMMLIGDNSDNAGNDADKGPNSTGSERFVFMAFYSPDGGGGVPSDTMSLIASEPGDSFDDSLEWRVIASGLSFDAWHTIRVVCNLNTDTYDVYVNDDPNPKATVTAYTAKTSVTHISFAQWNDGPGAFYVDNVEDAFLSVFAEAFGRTDCAGGCLGDLNDDDDVDGSDLAAYAAALESDCP